MSDIYEFFKPITLFKNSMGKSWLLVTKLGPCVALGYHLHPEQQITSTKTLIVLTQAKEVPRTSMRINSLYFLNCEKCFGIVQTIMSGGYSRKFLERQCKIQLPRENLGEQKIPEKALFRFSKSIKSKILTSMVPPLGYTGFITILPF